MATPIQIDEQSPSTQPTKPRGILKRPSVGAHEAGPRPTGLAWDEENLTINELGKNSTMKITEPKTPYVKYDAETDTVMDLDKIPGFELGALDGSYSPSSSSASGLASGPNSRRGSEASEKMVKVDLPDGASSDDSEEDEDNQDPETVEHRKQFANQRGGHYRNEAEAMKRAAAMLAEEDEADNDSGAEAPPVPPVPALPAHINGK